MTPLISDKAADGWADAYAYKAHTNSPRVVEVPARYWLAALPAIAWCVLLLVAVPNPVVM